MKTLIINGHEYIRRDTIRNYQADCTYYKSMANHISDMFRLISPLSEDDTEFLLKHPDLKIFKSKMKQLDTWFTNKETYDIEITNLTKKLGEQKEEFQELKSENSKLKRLMKLAIEDLCGCDICKYGNVDCHMCIDCTNYNNHFRWRHADEAEKVLGG